MSDNDEINTDTIKGPGDEGAKTILEATPEEMREGFLRLKAERESLSRRKDHHWDRMQHQTEELHGSLVSLLRTHEDATKELTEATSTMLRRSTRREVELSFALPGEDAGEFRFSCTLEALKDPDVRDALAKGRALLEAVAAWATPPPGTPRGR